MLIKLVSRYTFGFITTPIVLCYTKKPPRKVLSINNFYTLGVNGTAIAEASGDYEISHYRDNRKREIDFLIERSDGALLGVEVKAGSVATGDFKHLKWFAENVAKKPFAGIVIHSGKDVLPFGEGFYSVPFAALAQ